jgi:hypothetical protein
MSAGADMVGETVQGFMEAIGSAAGRLDVRATESGYRVVWDTVSVSLDAEYADTMNGHASKAWSRIELEALVVEDVDSDV